MKGDSLNKSTEKKDDERKTSDKNNHREEVNEELSTQFIISSESEVAETNEWVLNPTGFAVITAPVPIFFPTFIVIEFDVASDIVVDPPPTAIGSVARGYVCSVLW